MLIFTIEKNYLKKACKVFGKAYSLISSSEKPLEKTERKIIMFKNSFIQPVNSNYVAVSFSGTESELNSRETSMYNHGLISGSMLHLGSPESFRYVVVTRENLLGYVRSILLLNFDVERLTSKCFEKFVSRAAERIVSSIPDDKFLYYGEDFTGSDDYFTENHLSELAFS